MRLAWPVLVVALVLVLVALAGACSSSGETRGTSSASPASAPSTTAVTLVPPRGPVAVEPPPPGPSAERATVLSVTDGDTVRVELDGREERVRLIGINAPETGECFSTEATAALADLVDGRTVRLAADRTDRDQYGRLLRYLYVGDTLVQEALVRAGDALAYRFEPDTAHADELDAAQAAAEAAGAGLWAPDACGRVDADAGAVVLADLVADPPGDDTFDPNGEYVVVANRSADAVDLTGWGVKDESASHRFAFPPGFTLDAGASVTVHTGCGTASATDLFWCNQGSAVWNNDGDTAFLLDPDGNIVDTLAY